MMKYLFVSSLLFSINVGCAQKPLVTPATLQQIASTPTQVPTATATVTQIPTATYTPNPTPTNTQLPPFVGKLFFDMNGSGLHDEATFQSDSVRLADERQTLQPDLEKSIDAYINQHPELQEGDLVTILEPV